MSKKTLIQTSLDGKRITSMVLPTSDPDQLFKDLKSAVGKAVYLFDEVADNNDVLIPEVAAIASDEESIKILAFEDSFFIGEETVILTVGGTDYEFKTLDIEYAN